MLGKAAMPDTITAWTDPKPPAIDEAVSFVSITRREDGRIEFVSRDKAGRQVSVVVPSFAWTRMAQETSWDAPRYEARLRARSIAIAPELKPAG